MENHISISSQDFVSELQRNGYNFFTGVPCSIFKSLIKFFSEHQELGYIPAPREDASIGLAAGAYFAGKNATIIMQNSGLGYCLNALTSLNLIYKIPALILVSWRGYMGKDAPEHIIMGQICTKLCETADIPYFILEPSDYKKQLLEISENIKKTQIPNVMFVKEGAIS